MINAFVSIKISDSNALTLLTSVLVSISEAARELPYPDQENLIRFLDAVKLALPKTLDEAPRHHVLRLFLSFITSQAYMIEVRKMMPTIFTQWKKLRDLKLPFACFKGANFQIFSPTPYLLNIRGRDVDYDTDIESEGMKCTVLFELPIPFRRR